MFDFVKKLMFSRQLKMEEGKIIILNQEILLEPAITVVELIKFFQKNKNSKSMLNVLYEASKESGKEYMNKMKKFSGQKLDKLLEVGMGSLNLAGWGKIIVEGFDWKKRKGGIVRIEDSTVANLWRKKYGISKTPVDYIICGLITGGLSVICNTDLDGKEVKCSAMGNKVCEIIINPVNG